MHEEGIPSVVLAITDAAGPLHVTTVGYADVAARIPATETTLYETGSIGKSFTSIALLQLQDEGRIDLNAPVTDYLPWFEVQTDFDPIRVRHLMSHSAGLIRGTDFTPDPRYEVWSLRETRTSYPPGEHFHYSNVGYKALGLILERIEGRLYAEIIHDRVLAPLGMRNSVATVTHDVRPRMAVGYDRLYDDRPAHRTDSLVPATWFQTNTADGCLASSVLDLAAYLRLFMNAGVAGEQAVISPENFSAMTGTEIRTSPDSETSWYGYGIRSDELNGQRVIGHGGGMVGYFSDMVCLPDLGVGAVAMVNGIGNPSELTGYALRLLQAAATGDELPSVPDPVDYLEVEHVADFVGVYKGDAGRIEIRADGDRLQAVMHGERLPLEPRGNDRFFVAHPDLRRYLLSFGRDASGQVVEAFHGGAWYRGEQYAGCEQVDVPEELAAFPGDYRSHNPWHPYLRVMLQKDRLVLGHHPQPLERFEDGSFGHRDTPERLTFDTFVDGKALRLTYACNDFYRFFTGDE